MRVNLQFDNFYLHQKRKMLSVSTWEPVKVAQTKNSLAVDTDTEGSVLSGLYFVLVIVPNAVLTHSQNKSKRPRLFESSPPSSPSLH